MVALKLLQRHLKQQKQIYSCEANGLDWVWCRVAIMNRQIVDMFTDAC